MEVCIFDQLMLVKNMGGKEKDALRLLLKERKSILDSMFLETQAELEQLSKVNDSLYDLTQKLYSKTYSLYVALLKTGFDPEFDDDIMLDGTLRFRSDLNEDDDSVLAMEEDDQYGSDFRWMLGLINSLDEECETYPCARTWMSYSSKHSPDMTAQELGLANNLDDGISWDHIGQFNGICICHAFFELHSSSNLFSYPDILRMNDFWCEVKITHQHLTNQNGDRVSYLD